MNKTGIEYLDYTWNPIAMRCTPISEGCQKCWHIIRAKMLAKNPTISGFAQKGYSGHSTQLIKSRLDGPSKVKKSSIIGVQFMGDLFHETVDFEAMTDEVLQRIAETNHIYLILTKRPEIMAAYFRWYIQDNVVLPDNLWAGISAENQKRADERIPILLQIPAAVRFVSIEPMLGPVDIYHYLKLDCFYKDREDGTCCHPKNHTPECNVGICCLITKDHLQKLGWIIAGPETGPGARECKPEWIEDLYEQCKAAGVPFFDKRPECLAREFPCTK